MVDDLMMRDEGEMNEGKWGGIKVGWEFGMGERMEGREGIGIGGLNRVVKEE